MDERSRIMFAGGNSVTVEGAASLTAIRLSQNPGQLLEVTRADDGAKLYIASSQVLYVEPET